MKLMFITPQMGFGGAERVISILCKEWSRLPDTQVDLLILGPDVHSAYALPKAVTVIGLGGMETGQKFSHLHLLKKLRAALKTRKPDVLIAFMKDAGAYGALASAGLSIPLFYSERNDPTRINLSKKDQLHRKIVEASVRGVVFQTEGAKQCYRPAIQKKSQVILNPLDVDNIPEIQYSSPKKEIVTVGRLYAQKNQKLLIEAFSRIHGRFPDYVLKIYGEGPLREELTAQIQSLGLQNQVLLMGTSTQVLEEIRGSALFVLSSDFEGLPNTLIEAMCMGVPCISTDCTPGGARMLIRDGENGFLVPCGDSQALAEKMALVLSNSAEASRLAQNAKELRARVQAPVIAKQWLDFISDSMK